MAQGIRYDEVTTQPDDGKIHLAVQHVEDTYTLCGQRWLSGTSGEADCPECIKMHRSLGVIDGNGA